jgi:two-component system sensor histidine kinase VicK
LAYWEALAGIGAIGAAALAGLLLVYRRTRSRLRGLESIREALVAMSEGETATGALAADPALGPESTAWNKLLAETDQLRKRSVIQTARESLGDRRRAKSDLMTTCDALPQGLIVLDKNSRALYANGAAAACLGVSKQDLIGADILGYMPEGPFRQAVQQTASQPTERRTSLEVEQRDRAGGMLRFTVRPARSEDLVAAVIVIDDVTQQRVVEETRKAFVAQATHELRTPLTNIRLYVETALDEGANDAAVRAKCLNVINQEVRRLDRMVGDILSVSEIEAGSFKLRRDDVKILEMLSDLGDDYAVQAKEKGLQLNFDLPLKLPTLHGDRDKIALALHNLVGNALKYTPSGGTVTIRARDEDGRVLVDVCDTGIGIAAEDAERIFEKFYRANDQRVANITGSGLGLALAREVIRLHRGDITVQSEIDAGSTFTLSLPLVEGATEHEDKRTVVRCADGAQA